MLHVYIYYSVSPKISQQDNMVMCAGAVLFLLAIAILPKEDLWSYLYSAFMVDMTHLLIVLIAFPC